MSDVIDRDYAQQTREVADWGLDDTFWSRERPRRRAASLLDRDPHAPPTYDDRELEPAAGYGDPRDGERGLREVVEADEVDPFAEDRESLVAPSTGRRRRREVEDWFGDAPMPSTTRGRRFRRAEDWSAPDGALAQALPDDDPALLDDASPPDPYYADPDERRSHAPIDDDARGVSRRRVAVEDDERGVSRRRALVDDDERGSASRRRAVAEGDERLASGLSRSEREAPRSRRSRRRGEERADELWSAGSAPSRPPAAPRWTRPSLSLSAPSPPARPLPREYVDQSGRRTVVVRGHASGAFGGGAAALSHREPVALDGRPRGIARPERLAAWAVGLGFLLILIAVSTANAATV